MDLVRAGYDRISRAYRADDPPADVVEHYRSLLDAVPFGPGWRVADLGCGCGVPATRLLVERGCEVVGVDVSDVQVQRARELVPGARFDRADLADWDAPPGSFDAVVSLYALFHLPRSAQRALYGRAARWLPPGGHLLVLVGADDWTGTEDLHGRPMWWDHPASSESAAWIDEAGFDVASERFVTEGTSGHVLLAAVRR